jgi:hypothetical protein
MTINKVFIISFPENAQAKKNLFQARLNAFGLPKGVPVEIIEAPEKERVSDSLARHKLQVHQNGSTVTTMSWKEIAFAIGHWRVWQKSREEKHQSILVLEEGFLPVKKAYDRLNPEGPWEILYLGRQPEDDDGSGNGDTLYSPGDWINPGYRTDSLAYGVTGSGIRKMLKSGYDKHLVATGEFLSALQGVQPNEEVAGLFTMAIEALASQNNLIESEAMWPIAVERARRVNDGYKPLHPSLFDVSGEREARWTKKYLDPQLINREFALISDEPVDNIFSFPLFTPLFCKELIEEAEHYGKWMNYRHHDGPATDILLASFGFNEIYASIIRKYLYPLFYYHYQFAGDGWKNLKSQNFIVRYLSDQRAHLGLHNDGSYLSMVVTLNTNHEGGGTFFPKFKRLINHARPGYATVHPGLVGYVHGARAVTKGRRYILASFFFPEHDHPLKQGFY